MALKIWKRCWFRLDLDDDAGDLTRVTLPHPEIFERLKPGCIAFGE